MTLFTYMARRGSYMYLNERSGPEGKKARERARDRSVPRKVRVF